jgi:TPR repeat protein
LLGLMVLQGVGVTRDLERGRQLLGRACDAKDDEACRVLKIANEALSHDAGVPDLAGSGSDAGSAAHATGSGSGAS